MQTIVLTEEQKQLIGSEHSAFKFVDQQGNAIGQFFRFDSRPVTPHPRREVTDEELDEIRKNGKVYTSEEFMAMVRSHCK